MWHQPIAPLFDRNGNAGTTIWWDGRVVGGWAQGRTGEIVYRLLVDIGREGCDAVTAAADGIAAWPSSWRVTPRSRARLRHEDVRSRCSNCPP